jgi:hypothetical protein
MRLDDAIGVITATELMDGHGRGGIAASTSVGAPRIMPGSGTSTPTAQRRSVGPT